MILKKVGVALLAVFGAICLLLGFSEFDSPFSLIFMGLTAIAIALLFDQLNW